MKITACLLAFAAAQEQQGDDAAAAPAQESYGGAQESYGSEPMSYGEAAPTYRKRCMTSCPKQAPCRHRESGACTGYAMGGYEAHYGGEEQSYGGEQQTGGYRKLNACPEGTEDASCSTLNNRIVLWIAFALLFLPALYFFHLGFSDSNYADVSQSTDQAAIELVTDARFARFISGFICFIASLAYLTMALGYGVITRCEDGREFYYARYIDWAITTPLMLYELVRIANVASYQKYFLYSIDILMIIAGLIGALVSGSDKWAFFGFSMLCFLPILSLLCNFRDQANGLNANVYAQASGITIVTWFFYPVVWVLAEGTNSICASAEAYSYTVLDIIAKSVFGYVIASNAYKFNAGEVAIAGTSML